MPKIGLEATRANRIYRTGTEWYAWHLLQQFRKISGPIRFVVYYNQKLTEDLSWQQDNFYFKKLAWPFKKLWTHLRLGLELFFHPVDIFFATNTVPLLARGKIAVTIHDLGFLKNPELYRPLERIFHRISHWLYFKKAHKIIAISETTKQDIIKYYPKVKNKIKVIYSGYDGQVFKVMSSKERDDFRDLHDYPDKYILYVGRIETKKNIQNLIRAYKKLKTDWPLILAGRPGNFGFLEIQGMAQDPEVKDKIILLGYVSQRNYPMLLGSASLFVFPSRFEGFGLPVIEAMACGIPVAASSLPVIKEIAGESVHYFDPQNVDDMAEKIQELIDNQALREKLTKRGLEKVIEYSWSKCARQTVDFLLDIDRNNKI